MSIFRRSRRVGADAPDSQPHRATAPPEPPTPRRPHPDRSRTRADWAKLPPIEVPTTEPPLTFDGARFGHTVAGARSIAASDRPTRRHRTAGGVVMGLTSGETVIPPGADVPNEEADHRTSVDHGHERGGEPGREAGAGRRPVAAHRRPTVASSPHSGLITADVDHPFAPIPFRGAVDPSSATSWSLDSGFGNGDDVNARRSAPGSPRRRRGRPGR